jgi:hypothetical protein
MKSLQLLKKIENLPLFEKKEVEDFIDFLLFKNKKEQISKTDKRAFGVFKGKVNMAQDFDEPISDFNDYSQ